MPKVPIGSKELRILVETVKLAEEIKPSQQAKRNVFRKHRILGTDVDRVLTAIFYNTMRRLGIIDKVISDVTKVPNVLILDPWLRAALRVATNLLLFDRISDKLKRLLKWKVADYISAMTHPYVGMYYWRVFDEIEKYEIRPKDKDEELEIKYLLPSWFISKMRSLLGDSEAEELFKALNTKLPISVRVNTLKASVEEVVEELRKLGENPVVSSYVPVVVKFDGPLDFDNTRIYREGKVVIQEEAAAVASILLNPKPGETVVDMCAAPGGKTTHIAELMKNRGIIYAFDIDKYRIRRMKELIRRTGVRIVKIFKEDANRAPEILGEEVADKVMLDAPCTASGTIMKNLELRWRLRPDGITEIAQQQYELLKTATKLVKPGGNILYCTCSLFPEENEELISKILREHSEMELVPLKKPYSEGFLKGTMRAWPHRHGTVGFFYALLRKKEK